MKKWYEEVEEKGRESTIAQRKHCIFSLSLKNKTLPLFLLWNALAMFYTSLAKTLPSISEVMGLELEQ